MKAQAGGGARRRCEEEPLAAAEREKTFRTQVSDTEWQEESRRKIAAKKEDGAVSSRTAVSLGTIAMRSAACSAPCGVHVLQVIQQALHRQPSTAAQYLQQMYAAQQQHLMLQTAALQQQHLSTAQLQSLAAVQQASIAAGRQNSSQNGTSSTQTGSSQTTINLTTSPATAQLISRAQTVNPAPSGISQQAVLLGNGSSPTLTASQAQMYLRAQMAQQSNLVHVARSLGRAVPLSPQLILAPTATVTALQSETSANSNTQSASAQVQNLALRSQQGASSSSPSTGLQALSLKQTSVSIQPTPLIKSPIQSSSSLGSGAGKGPLTAASGDGPKKLDSGGEVEAKAVNMSRSVTSSHPLIAPAYAQIQPQALIKQQPQQFVIQPQAPPTPRMQTQLLQTTSIQSHPQTASLGIQSSTQSSSVGGPMPVLPKPPTHSQCPAPSQQATIFHSTVSQHGAQLGLGQTKPQPVQLTAINLQIQPAHSQVCYCSTLTHPTTSSAETPCATTGTGVTPAMTSGTENETPATTGSTPQNGESKPPQAIVKPHVLTHVIEGFVIQEGAEPFPVSKLHCPLRVENNSVQISESQANEYSDDTNKHRLSPLWNEPKLTCELCGWVDFAYKFKGSKRFCSVVCAKRYNVGCTKRIGLFHPDRTKTASDIVCLYLQKLSGPQQSQGESVSSPLPSQPSQGESSPCSDISSYEEPPSPLSAASSGPMGPPRGVATPDPEELPLLSQHFLPCDPTNWNVQEVFEFIRSLPGCQEIADEFRSQEIDGQAMLLLKEDHLMSAMNIKLGPALKIFARINMLKDS
uniref:Polyhomeotic-like protein 2 n=1 Tax=Electrophorus electricus TaxID=8005 RepID=A0A4W4HKW6_ELEEL